MSRALCRASAFHLNIFYPTPTPHETTSSLASSQGSVGMSCCISCTSSCFAHGEYGYCLARYVHHVVEHLLPSGDSAGRKCLAG